nr:hypothetical protein Aca09nite_36170 [Actinoplanes campanulatus]
MSYGIKRLLAPICPSCHPLIRTPAPAINAAPGWYAATTAGFSKVVASGTATARYEDAHAIHVVARGLKPGTVHYYRFRARGHISQVGRTRTAPASGTFGPDLRIAVASCANYESGYYTAYRRMAEDRPDLVLFLGDYIYEESRSPGRVRTHAGGETVTLADYRRRYAQYRTDPDLRAAHAAAPWIVVPDDHEVENNYAKLTRANNRPVLSASRWRARQAAAYRAFYENMPLRSATFQRRVHWGRLATFHMLDTRRFRDDQACGDYWKVCGAAELPGRTITGAAQEKWLLDGLARHYGTWDVLGQQVFFAQFADRADLYVDQLERGRHAAHRDPVRPREPASAVLLRAARLHARDARPGPGTGGLPYPPGGDPAGSARRHACLLRHRGGAPGSAPAVTGARAARVRNRRRGRSSAGTVGSATVARQCRPPHSTASW